MKIFFPLGGLRAGKEIRSPDIDNWGFPNKIAQPGHPL